MYAWTEGFKEKVISTERSFEFGPVEASDSGKIIQLTCKVTNSSGDYGTFLLSIFVNDYSVSPKEAEYTRGSGTDVSFTITDEVGDDDLLNLYYGSRLSVLPDYTHADLPETAVTTAGGPVTACLVFLFSPGRRIMVESVKRKPSNKRFTG